MPPAKKKADDKPADQAIDGAAEELKQGAEVGFIGTKVDPLPNSAHSLESGPDAPTAAEQKAALAEADAS